MKAFGVFEGGGVRGYAHLGALKACEDRSVEFIGVAGTSIGAIVATFVAAGFTSSELYAIDDDGHETGLLAVDPVAAFLDHDEYERLERLMGWGRHLNDRLNIVRTASGKSAAGRTASKAWDACWAFYRKNLEVAAIAAPAHYLGASSVATFHRRLLRRIWSRAGALGNERFLTWLDDRLKERIRPEGGGSVTFADMPIPLSIIATNLSTGSMTVFDRNSHPTMPVAIAAMASATYPLVFEPILIEGEAFVDGGLVSNFPAWTLDGVRAQEETIIPTFGFRVVDAPGATRTPWPGRDGPQFIEVVRRIVTSAMAGRGDLEIRRVDDLHPMVVATHVKATDFHVIMKERAGLYDKGRTEVLRYFKAKLGPRDPVEMELRLRNVLDIVRRVTFARDSTVRAYILQPIDDLYARVVYAALYPGDADDRLSMRLDCVSQALCLKAKEPVLLRVDDLDRPQRLSAATKYIHALRPTAVRHVYCVPMFDDHREWQKQVPASREAPLAALCFDFVDADDRLLLETDVEDTLASIATALVDLWKDRPVGDRDETPEIDQPPAGDWTAIPQVAGYYVSNRKVRKKVGQRELAEIDRATL